MKDKNALSLVKRYDGSYFYIVELGFSNGLYKYVLANWDNGLTEPLVIYSHTKRSNLTAVEQEFFDNNLLSQERLKRYLGKNNTYIGGIDRYDNNLVREFKDGLIRQIKYKVYIRNNNYILIDYITGGPVNTYNIDEFISKDNQMNFNSSTIYTEKDLLNLTEEEQPFVLNELLNQERVLKKVTNNHGYVGTIEKINGVYKKVRSEKNELEIANKY